MDASGEGQAQLIEHPFDTVAESDLGNPSIDL